MRLAKNNIYKIILFLIILLIIIPNFSIAVDENMQKIKNEMNGATVPIEMSTSDGIGGAINTTIGLIQIAGTGISVIMVLLQGIKYLMASPSDKASVKNTAVPIIIGNILLIGAVNIVGIIYTIAHQIREENFPS